MAVIAGGADKLKEYVLSFGTDDYAEHIASAALNATQSVEHWQGGTPDAVFADVSAPTWTLTIRMSQGNGLSASRAAAASPSTSCSSCPTRSAATSARGPKLRRSSE